MPDYFEAVDVGDFRISADQMSVIAKDAERAGFRAFWIAETYHNRSCIATAALVASRTNSIKIGLGIVSCFSRHPAIIAMEAATLDEISGGRLILGIGPVRSSMRKHAVKGYQTIRAVKESVEIIRKMQGDPFIFEGEEFKIAPPGSSLGFKPPQRKIPIYIGAMAPRMFTVAGSLGDGILFSYYTSPLFLKHGLEVAAQARKSVGLDPRGFDSVGYIRIYVGKNRDSVKDRARKELANYLSTASVSEISFRTEYAGITGQELDSLVKEISNAQVNRVDPHEAITDDILDKFLVAGSPEDCVEKVRNYLSSGLKVPALFSVGPDRREGIKLLCEHVVPHLIE